MTNHTVDDCCLDGTPIALDRWPDLTSDELTRVVGDQDPGGDLEHARDYHWQVIRLPLEELRRCNEDGEEPDGGWIAAHQSHCEQDALAIKNGSPEYEGRPQWLREQWCEDTAIYPLYAVRTEEGGYRLWDGYRRLAGGFANGLTEALVVLGTPR